eukprot:9297876-Pyramimonas_sp.AAC.1
MPKSAPDIVPEQGRARLKAKISGCASLESQNGAVTDRAVTSESSKTSPHGPSPRGLGTPEAPVARDILGKRPESQNRAVAPSPHRLAARCGHRPVWGPPSLQKLARRPQGRRGVRLRAAFRRQRASQGGAELLRCRGGSRGHGGPAPRLEECGRKGSRRWGSLA